MQRHPGENWDAGGKDSSKMIQWLQENVAKYKGNPDRMFIWAHSAGNGPLGVYIGHPELQGPKGAGVKGAIFMSGNPVPGVGAPEAAAGRGAPGNRGPAPAGGPAANPLAGAGSTCGVANSAGGNAKEGAVNGPSRGTAGGARGGRGGGGGAPGGAGGGEPVDGAATAPRTKLPGLQY